MTGRFRTLLILALPLVLVFALVACGDDDDDDNGDNGQSTATEQTATATEEGTATGTEEATETEDEETATSEETSTSTTAAGNGAAEEAKVEVGDNFFEPAELTVPAGTTVTWEWTGAVPHDVVSDDEGGPLESEIQTEGTYEFTFDEAGTYDYHCQVHPTEMMGTITVE